MYAHSHSFLTAMGIEEATAEFLSWGLYPQADVLAALDTFTAVSAYFGMRLGWCLRLHWRVIFPGGRARGTRHFHSGE